MTEGKNNLSICKKKYHSPVADLKVNWVNTRCLISKKLNLKAKVDFVFFLKMMELNLLSIDVTSLKTF